MGLETETKLSMLSLLKLETQNVLFNRIAPVTENDEMQDFIYKAYHERKR